MSEQFDLFESTPESPEAKLLRLTTEYRKLLGFSPRVGYNSTEHLEEVLKNADNIGKERKRIENEDAEADERDKLHKHTPSPKKARAYRDFHVEH